MEYYLAIKKKKDLYISNNPENEKKKTDNNTERFHLYETLENTNYDERKNSGS